MTAKDQTDITHFDQPLAAVAQHVEALHIRLDNFAAGKTDELVGQQTRFAIRQALKGLDEALVELRYRRATAAPRLRGHVTAAMRDELARAIELADQITRAHRRILEESSEMVFIKFSHFHASHLMGELEMTLTRLDHDLTISGLPEVEPTPADSKTAHEPVGFRLLRRISALIHSSRALVSLRQKRAAR